MLTLCLRIATGRSGFTALVVAPEVTLRWNRETSNKIVQRGIKCMRHKVQCRQAKIDLSLLDLADLRSV